MPTITTHHKNQTPNRHQGLRFDQYRKLLIFERTHPFIVLTDVSNFFDSILYGRVEQSLYGLRASPKLIGLLSM